MTENPSGLGEELALEEHALGEHEARAAWLWNSRQYTAALRERAQAAQARAHIDTLRQEGISK